MNIDRRGFFKVVLAGAATAVSGTAAEARALKPRSADAVGILYDATLCIGCKACEVGCKRANEMPSAHDAPLEAECGVEGVWDAGNGLSSRTLTKIKLYKSGSGTFKDQEEDGFSFLRRGCMHCVDPNCVSACPVSAMTKDPITGIVSYNPDACIGCRYCQLACPYNVPRFEFDKTFPKMVKCEMCTERQARGEIPACCEACPTGASLFGRVSELLDEAHRRLAFQPGEFRDYPLHSLGSGATRQDTVSHYQPKVFGETDGGGTQTLLLAGVPFDKLGLPELGDDSRARLSETIQHSLYQGMMAPVLLLGGLVYTVYRNTAEERAEEEAASGSEEARRHE